MNALCRSIACFVSSLAAFTTASLAAAESLTVNTSANAKAIPLYEVFELSFQHDAHYANPFFDAGVDLLFSAPSGKRIRVGGFHYGSARGPEIVVHTNASTRGPRKQVDYRFATQDLWKARFAPNETGLWNYSFVFTNINGGKASGSGSFTCLKGRGPRHGFVRPNPDNPLRWVFDDGTPYFPIGLQECLGDGAGVGSALAAMSMEGPFRLDRKGRPAPPPGAIFQPGPANNPVNGDVYFRQYSHAGFNLYRFSQQNCSFTLYRDLDHYHVQQAVMVDELLQHARRYRFRIFYGLFGYQPVFNDHLDDPARVAKLRRFVEYSVNRWGAYVDIWEFLNEQKVDARWYENMVPHLSGIDPYHHPITTSWERPELPGIEVNAPHWYSGVRSDLSCDRDTADHARNWKRFNKPVIVGEQGNSASKEELQIPGIGGVWDIGSATRMRIRNWTALFNEIAFVFWNTSYAKDGHSMNIWLGPRERQYVHAMQDFTTCLDKDIRPAPVTLSQHNVVRALALASKEHAAVYLHHFIDHTNAVTNLSVTIDVPKVAKGYWYSPENADILRRIDLPAGQQAIEVPAFKVDLALLITSGAAPDIDRDGIPNDLDPDDDNDGVTDSRDAFPLDPEEWADADHDDIGDNFDADVDADGRGDDKNRNGIPDNEEMDLDRDGVLKANAIPWDAFPLDPKEWHDTDGDGIGDNADTDKDGDGWPDEEEKRAGTDPLNPFSFPVR